NDITPPPQKTSSQHLIDQPKQQNIKKITMPDEDHIDAQAGSHPETRSSTPTPAPKADSEASPKPQPSVDKKPSTDTTIPFLTNTAVTTRPLNASTRDADKNKEEEDKTAGHTVPTPFSASEAHRTPFIAEADKRDEDETSSRPTLKHE